MLISLGDSILKKDPEVKSIQTRSRFIKLAMYIQYSYPFKKRSCCAPLCFVFLRYLRKAGKESLSI